MTKCTAHVLYLRPDCSSGHVYVLVFLKQQQHEQQLNMYPRAIFFSLSGRPTIGMVCMTACLDYVTKSSLEIQFR